MFYVVSGKGVVKGGGKSYDVSDGSLFLAPENLEFTIANTSDESMIFYLVAEPTPKGFRPNDYIVVHSEKNIPLDYSDSHWINSWSYLIKPDEGLAQLQLVLPVWLQPNTFAQPHSHNATTEEIWVTLDGDVKTLLGKQIRDIPPGTAYLIPPDDKTPHANFNITDKPLKFFYFARFADKEPRK
jgi:mannose-6-phosphate isomerase-like protein (cupin superfamily)